MVQVIKGEDDLVDATKKIDGNKQSEGKILYYSVLNVLACLGVCILHCNGVFWTFPKGRLWIDSNILETVFYFAVPIFFMLTGATLVDYRDKYNTKVFFKKRIKRTLLPFLFWSLFGMLYQVLFSNGDISELSILHIIEKIFNTEFTGIYWFFIPLFAVYLCMPLLNAIENKKKIFIYMIIVGVLLKSLLPLVFNILTIRYNAAIVPPVINNYMIYVLIGYMISHCEIKLKYRLIIYFFGALGWGMHFFGTVFLSLKSDAIVDIFKGYENLPALMYSVAIFLLIKSIKWEVICGKIKSLRKLLGLLASNTFGVYLIHIYLIQTITDVTGLNGDSIWWRTLGACGIFILCEICVYLIKKIPFIGSLV